MGLFLWIIDDSPRSGVVDRADNGLTALMDVDMLDRDLLLALTARAGAEDARALTFSSNYLNWG